MAEQIQEALKILRRKQVEARVGLSRSTLYQHIQSGTFMPPVRISRRAVGWPSLETEMLLAARVAGKSDEEIRTLVQSLVAARSRKSA